MVERLSCIQSLEKYNPRIVIASWIHREDNYIGTEILKFPSVEYFINIQHDGLTLKAEDAAKTFKLESARLGNAEKYGICKADYHCIQPHTEVVLVKKPACKIMF